MSRQTIDSERERLLGNNRMNYNNAINSGIDIMIDDLEDKTSKLLQVTQSVNQTMLRDEETRRTLFESVDKSDVAMSKGRRFVSDITNDPTYFGVFKIALLVFSTLSILYFGGKFCFRFIFNNS